MDVTSTAKLRQFLDTSHAQMEASRCGEDLETIDVITGSDDEGFLLINVQERSCMAACIEVIDDSISSWCG